MTTPDRLVVRSAAWPEVRADDDLATLVAESVDLADGDVVALTSKVVSKAEGMASDRPRHDVVAADTRRVVARRGAMVIAETRHGLVLAAAGVDESNTPVGTALSLPADPDATARRLRAALAASLDVNVAVIITDTAGRAWREGQTDIAIGCAGIEPLLDLRGRADAEGRVLQVTAPAVADEIAGLADLVKGKATRRPIAVVSGLGMLVLPRGDHGPGARAIVRDADGDLFGLGARDAATAAAARDDDGELSRFPLRTADDPDPFARLTTTHLDVSLGVERRSPDDGAGGAALEWTVEVSVRDDAGADAWLEAGRLAERADVLAAANRLALASIGPLHTPTPGWRAAHRAAWLFA